MAKRTFPGLIHVTWEGEGDDTYLSVWSDGIAGIDQNGQAVGVYQLVDDGRVEIAKAFKSRRTPRHSRRKSR